jgi:hypothetical protein
MNRFYAAILLCLIQLTLRAEINTTGIPEGAMGLVYFNEDTFSKTQLGGLALSALDKKLQETPNGEIIRKNLGIKNIKEVSLGIYPHINTAQNPESAQFVAIIRGNFSKEKIEKFALDNQIPSQKIQGFSAWDMAEVNATMKKEPLDPKNKNQVLLIAFADDLFIFCSPLFADLSIDTLNLKTKSYKLPDSFTEKLKTSPQNWLAFYGDFTKDAKNQTQNKENGLQFAQAFLGEDKDLTQLRCTSQYINETKAKASTLQLKTTLAFMSMALRSASLDSTMNKESQQALADLLKNIKIDSDQSTQKISADYPSKKVAEAFESSLKQAAPKEKIANEKN